MNKMLKIIGPIITSNSEIYILNGIKFRRYPKSKHHFSRSYYTCSGKFKKDGITTLHREIYKYYFGEIPSGHSIHHKDHNTLNNDINNLECMKTSEHRRHHMMTPEKRKMSSEIGKKYIHTTRYWLNTDDGIRHCNEVLPGKAREYWANPEYVNKICLNCNCEYETTKNRGNISTCCSKECYYKLTTKDQSFYEQRICVVCGNCFSAYKKNAKKTCSPECREKSRMRSRSINAKRHL